MQHAWLLSVPLILFTHYIVVEVSYKSLPPTVLQRGIGVEEELNTSRNKRNDGKLEQILASVLPVVQRG
eukprot:3895891-Amphidinium_carterae.1